MDEIDAASADVSPKREAACILSKLENVTVQEGAPFKLACVVDGIAPITAQWYKGEEALDEGYEYVMKFQSNMATLHVNESFPEDSGTYTCHVTNVVGSDESSAQVTVLGESRQWANEQNIYHLCSSHSSLWRDFPTIII